MNRYSVSYVFTLSVALGMLGIIIVALLLLHGCQSVGATSKTRSKSVTKPAFSPSLSGPSTPMAHQGRALLPGSRSGCGTLSLAYICRSLAIDTLPTQIAGLTTIEALVSACST